MKKIIVLFLFCFLLIGCSGGKLPSREDILKDLKNAKYEIEELHDLSIGDSKLSVTNIIAKGEDNYLAISWSEDEEVLDQIYQYYINQYVDYQVIVKVGNLVFCGTEDAVMDAGLSRIPVTVAEDSHE